MNAAEHGNHYRADRSVGVEVIRSGQDLLVRDLGLRSGRSDSGGDDAKPGGEVARDSVARGWGLFLIEKMVDHVEVRDSPDGHIVELMVRLDQSPAK